MGKISGYYCDKCDKFFEKAGGTDHITSFEIGEFGLESFCPYLDFCCWGCFKTWISAYERQWALLP